MAKDLTSNIIANKSKRYGTEPINLLEIDFGGVTGTKYYSDREVTVGGNAYEAVVQDWGDIDFILNRSATTTDLHITLVNTLSSPISNIFATETPESKTARLYQWFVGLEEADKTLIFNGKIVSPVKYGLETVEFDIVDKIIDLESSVGRVITQEGWPRSLPSHRGRIIPKVFGSVTNVPAVCVFTAGKSELRETLNDVAMSIEVDDGSVFPLGGAWVLVIEDEQIFIGSRPGGNTLLVATGGRGYNGTTAALHTKGTHIYEQLSSFRYQVFDDEGDVKAASISNVRVNGVLLDDTQYTIDQVNYPGQIVFDSYPQIDAEKETDFDDYTFDTVVDDGTVPYADSSENLTDDNNSNYAWMKSGQRVTLNRAADLNNNNQFKRAWLSVTYFTDKQEWEGNIQARAYWDNNMLGTLPDPTFDPLIEEEEEVESASGNQIISPNNPVDPTQYGGPNDGIQGPEAELSRESYSEEVDPSNLTIETMQFNPDAYELDLNPVPDNRVPAEFFFAWADGVIANVGTFQHPCVGAFPRTWEGDVNNFKWINWVFSGFRFAPPSSGGTARIVSVSIRFNDEFGPYGPRSNIYQYRAKKSGERDINVINTSNLGLQVYPLYVHEISEFYAVIRSTTYVHTRTRHAEEINAVTAELQGKMSDVYIVVEYEITKEAPQPTAPPVTITPPVVILKPVRKSHEVTKTFEITDYVDSWGDLLSKNAEIIFESDGNKPGTNLFIKDMHIMTESGRYTFEYTDEITADVDGYYVDGTEIDTDYGIDGELIARPDQICKLILTWKNTLFDLSDLDTAYYAAAASFFESQYYRLNFAIVNETTRRELLEKIAFQTRTDQYWEAGVHKLKVLEVASAVSKQITDSDIENVAIQRSDIEELVNLLEVRYTIDYSFLIAYTPNKFRDIITMENTDSQTEYGTRKSTDETFYFDLIRDDITASHVAAYYLSFYSVIRRYITMKCFLNQLELDKHDIIGVTFPIDNLANTPGRILSNKLSMGGNTEIDQIELYVLMEDYTYHKLELTDGVQFSDAIQLAVIPLVSLADGIEFSDEIYFGFEANLANSVVFSDTFSYNIHKTLFIREGYAGGFGSQPWGSSAWGGNDKSFIISDELTVEKIAALGTGFINVTDAFSVSDQLIMTLVHRLINADNDAFNLWIEIRDNLTISLV
jgi:hypothetical protein